MHIHEANILCVLTWTGQGRRIKGTSNQTANQLFRMKLVIKWQYCFFLFWSILNAKYSISLLSVHAPPTVTCFEEPGYAGRDDTSTLGHTDRDDTSTLDFPSALVLRTKQFSGSLTWLENYRLFVRTPVLCQIKSFEGRLDRTIKRIKIAINTNDLLSTDG